MIAKAVILIILLILYIFLLKKLTKAMIEHKTTTTNKVIKLGKYNVINKPFIRLSKSSNITSPPIYKTNIITNK